MPRKRLNTFSDPAEPLALLAFRDRYLAKHPWKPYTAGIHNLIVSAAKGARIPKDLRVLVRRRTKAVVSRRWTHCRFIQFGSTRPIPFGLGLMLTGFLLTAGRERGKGPRDTIRATLIIKKAQERAGVVCVLLLWDLLLLNRETLEHWAEARTLAVQCENRLEYWPDWRRVARTMKKDAPELWDHYSAQAETLDGFRMVLRRD